MVWCGVGQGRVRRLLSPGSLQPPDCTLGEGCREGREDSGQQDRDRKEPATHTSP